MFRSGDNQGGGGPARCVRPDTPAARGLTLTVACTSRPRGDFIGMSYVSDMWAKSHLALGLTLARLPPHLDSSVETDHFALEMIYLIRSKACTILLLHTDYITHCLIFA